MPERIAVGGGNVPPLYALQAAASLPASARIIDSKWIIIYELVHSVLMQPNSICISSDEFVDVDAINVSGRLTRTCFPFMNTNMNFFFRSSFATF
jgi:hypothetical protein